MKYSFRKTKVTLLLTAILVCSFLAIYLYVGNNCSSDVVTDEGETFLFVPPAFAQSTSESMTFLEEEAGMSMYVNIGQSIDLSVAKNVYKTIEKETSNYIIGSFSLPNFPETEDVHCFIHTDGWIVIYYLKHEPISKIIDWTYYSDETGLTKTKLQVGLEKMGSNLGVTITNAKYYNFNRPDADKWVVIIDVLADDAFTTAEDSFNFMIPGEIMVYEGSWSHCFAQPEALVRGIGQFNFDRLCVNQVEIGNTKYGRLTDTQLETGLYHEVTIRYDLTSMSERTIMTNYIGIILAYQEP